MAKKRPLKRRNRTRSIAGRPTDRIADPVIHGEYVGAEPVISVSGNIPSGNLAKTQGQRAVVQAQSTSFQGPIPPPELLREYNEIVPNGADRIVKMAEAQSAHRIDLESVVVKGDDRRANWGLFTGYTIGVLIIVLSFVLILKGHDIAGTVLGTVDLVGLIGVFVTGRYDRRRQLQSRDEKNQALTRRRN